MKRNTRFAFTMIELIVVIAIIGIVIGLILPAIQKIRERATSLQCQDNMRIIGMASLQFHQEYGYYPRNTIRPWGVTKIGAEPAGNLKKWDAGSTEPWIRQITQYLFATQPIAQQSLNHFGCPLDPRGTNYVHPAYGFTWYVGVYSRRYYINDGIIIDDSPIRARTTVNVNDVKDGASRTMMFAERAPDADGAWGWWDYYRGDLVDTISPAKGFPDKYHSGVNGKCPDEALYRRGKYQDNCLYNGLWSYHNTGANFCMGDGSVRVIRYEAANQTIGQYSLLEALATRKGGEQIVAPD